MNSSADFPMPAAVERWEVAGGTWSITSVDSGSATVDLLRCDGGELAERIRLSDPVELRWAAMLFAAMQAESDTETPCAQ